MDKPKDSQTAPPKAIYLQYHGDGEPDDGPVRDRDVTWCRDKIFESDLQYVRAGRSAPERGATDGSRLAASSWVDTLAEMWNRELTEKSGPMDDEMECGRLVQLRECLDQLTAARRSASTAPMSHREEEQ